MKTYILCQMDYYGELLTFVTTSDKLFQFPTATQIDTGTLGDESVSVPDYDHNALVFTGENGARHAVFADNSAVLMGTAPAEELTCWSCDAVVSPDDPICLECETECRFNCGVCGKQHTPSEPGFAAWVEAPEEPSMCALCSDCEDSLPRHPEEGWPLTPNNIFA